MNQNQKIPALSPPNPTKKNPKGEKFGITPPKKLDLGTNPRILRARRPGNLSGFRHRGQIPAEIWAKIPENLRPKWRRSLRGGEKGGKKGRGEKRREKRGKGQEKRGKRRGNGGKKAGLRWFWVSFLPSPSPLSPVTPQSPSWTLRDSLMEPKEPSQ